MNDNETVRSVADALGADVFLVSSPITYPTVDLLREQCSSIEPRTKCVLILTTWGGVPDAAYLIARNLRATYSGRLTVCVFGFCKSAGTLLALGGREIVVGERGELGPLDVQVSQRDELDRFGSGLEIFSSLNVIAGRSVTMFNMFVRAIVDGSKRQISTRTAADLAAKLTVGLMSPISQQVDPLRLGRRQRSLDVAKRYAMWLGASEEVALRLTTGYPEHGFVIDLPEAERLFGSQARAPNEAERRLESVLSARKELYLPPPSEGKPFIELLSTPTPRGVTLPHDEGRAGDHGGVDEERDGNSQAHAAPSSPH